MTGSWTPCSPASFSSIPHCSPFAMIQFFRFVMPLLTLQAFTHTFCLELSSSISYGSILYPPGLSFKNTLRSLPWLSPLPKLDASQGCSSTTLHLFCGPRLQGIVKCDQISWLPAFPTKSLWKQKPSIYLADYWVTELSTLKAPNEYSKS